MNRIRKSRGKRIDNNTWVFGDLIHYYDSTRMSILTSEHEEHEIIPETVGEFSGLNEEMNGTKQDIYEDDLVEVNTLGINYQSKKITGVVVFEGGCFTVEFSEPVYDIVSKCDRRSLYLKCFVVNHAVRVIGTKYDIPKMCY